LRPMELNILYKMDGDGIFLYDTTQTGNKVKKKQRDADAVKHWDYFMKDRFLLWNELLPVACRKVYNLWCIMKRHKK